MDRCLIFGFLCESLPSRAYACQLIEIVHDLYGFAGQSIFFSVCERGEPYTDLHKLVQKQDMCHMCHQFSPRHLMVLWCACRHSFCVICLNKSRNVRYLNRLSYVPPLCLNWLCRKLVPECPAENCQQELTIVYYDMLYGQLGFKLGANVGYDYAFDQSRDLLCRAVDGRAATVRG